MGLEKKLVALCGNVAQDKSSRDGIQRQARCGIQPMLGWSSSGERESECPECRVKLLAFRTGGRQVKACVGKAAILQLYLVSWHGKTIMGASRVMRKVRCLQGLC